MFKDNRTPLIDPLLNLLRSRKFLVAVLTVVVDVIVAYAPMLEPVRGELLTVLTTVGSVLVATIAFEDGKAKEKAR